MGFRYTTFQVAKEYEVSGLVKNLPDGRVQLEAEGSPQTVKDFIAAVEERLHGYIRKTERQQSRPEAKFQGFSIQ